MVQRRMGFLMDPILYYKEIFNEKNNKKTVTYCVHIVVNQGDNEDLLDMIVQHLCFHRDRQQIDVLLLLG
jgi:hypothetical protein